MGQSIFGATKDPKEVMKQNQRAIKKAVRELEREISTQNKNEAKLLTDIKLLVKKGQMESARQAVKDLQKCRQHIQKFHGLASNLKGVGLKMQTVKSYSDCFSSLQGVAKTMKAMNKSLNSSVINSILADFMKENEHMELNMERLDDVMDETMGDQNSTQEEENIFAQILDELGLASAGGVHAPSVSKSDPVAHTVAAQPIEETDDLEARLNNLRK